MIYEPIYFTEDLRANKKRRLGGLVGLLLGESLKFRRRRIDRDDVGR